MARLASILALAALGGGCVFIGSGGPDGWGDDDANTDTQTVTFDQTIDEVNFDLGAGDFELRRGNVSEVIVERTLFWGGSEPEVGATVRDGTLTLTSGCDFLAFNCVVDHLVIVPNSVRVGGSTGSGDVKIVDLAGDVGVLTGSGHITLENIAGNITAETGSGGMTLLGATGNMALDAGSGDIEGVDIVADFLVAETGSGSIDLSYIAVPLLVDVETGSGSVALRVPSGEYRLDLDTGSGSISVSGIENQNQGDATIIARTGSGSLDLTGY